MTRSVLAALVSAVLAPAAFGQGNFDPPPPFPPDDATMKQIAAKTAELRAAVAALPKEEKPDVWADVAVYLKAAEWIVRHNEFYTKDSGKQTLAVLDAGLARAKASGEHHWLTPWRDVRGKPVIRGYVSLVDGSVQPYSLTVPPGYDDDAVKKWRLDVVLHGRDQTLTEVKFINARETAKAGKVTDRIILEAYGRGNNAYRWSGETDVFEAIYSATGVPGRSEGLRVDPNRKVIRGFSMGGAGTWHLGLHRPAYFSAMQPGAGFTSTRGYVKNLAEPLPEYVVRCLHIYDAVDYAENALVIPVVAYSGEKDPQKAAADNIEAALKRFKEQAKFTHLVAPGLEHRQPPEWFAKCDAALSDFPPRKWDDRFRFVTYTTRYTGGHGGATIQALDQHYEKSVIDCKWGIEGPTVTTTNIRVLYLFPPPDAPRLSPSVIVIDGQRLPWPKREDKLTNGPTLAKKDGHWRVVGDNEWYFLKLDPPEKVHAMQGPIDDAFMEPFKVIGPSRGGWHPSVTKYAAALMNRFAGEWDKYFRGALPAQAPQSVDRTHNRLDTLVLFGDPGSNPLIAEIVEQLPMTWTKDKLVVNGIEYNPKTHTPVLIYPCPGPISPPGSVRRYVVINSGHTFRAADLKGTNALLYPRLGDWAVLKVAPTDKDPAAAEVVAAGIFDEFWQFASAELPTFTAPGSKLEKLWGDGEFTEGPAAAPDGSIYFSDIGNRIMRFDPKTGKTSTFRDPSGRSNGLKFDASGRLIACEGANTGGNRRISVTEKDGTVKTLADKFDGKRFNSPNDLTLDTQGRVYFTDPRYVGTEPRELDHESVYRIDPDGTVTRIIADVTKPNGIVISPDGKTLYLAEHRGDPKGARQLLAYPLKDNGTVGARKVLFDFGADRGIDGMTVTADGLIVATAGTGKTAGIHFFTSEGKKVGFLPTPEDPSNCCFGGPGSKTLYVTAGKSLYRIELTVGGK